MNTNRLKTLSMTFLLAAAMASLAGTSEAVIYTLRADTVNLTMADGTIVPAWGFADDSGGAGTGTVTVPGPQLIVPSGENLTINLTNNLPVPVSINIPGQPYPAGAAPRLSSGRVLSFTHEVAGNGGTGTVTFSGLHAGTFRYESGTHPAMEVPMGLYGALIVRSGTAGQAYGTIGSAYDNEAVVLFSEIDPAFNAYVAANNSVVDTGNKINYSISFAPKYYLINGKSFPQTADISAPAGQRTLLRMVNACVRNIVPTVQGNRLDVIAEDGYLLNFPRHEFAPPLSAGKTLDAILAPAAIGYHALYDRRLGLTNGGASPGGMLTFVGDLTCSPLKGDVTGDAKVTAADAMTVLRDFVSGGAATLPTGDVGQLDAGSQLPCGNGAVDLLDALMLLKKATGMLSY